MFSKEVYKRYNTRAFSESISLSSRLQYSRLVAAILGLDITSEADATQVVNRVPDAVIDSVKRYRFRLVIDEVHDVDAGFPQNSFASSAVRLLRHICHPLNIVLRRCGLSAGLLVANDVEAQLLRREPKKVGAEGDTCAYFSRMSLFTGQTGVSLTLRLPGGWQRGSAWCGLGRRTGNTGSQGT